METAELALALKLASPCIINSNYLPILCHYCFTGDEMYAYDDVSAIIVGLKTGLKCGLRGETLARIVEHCGSKITLKQNGSEVVLTSGTSTSRLPILDPREFVFKEEDEEYRVHFKLTSDSQAALSLCVASVSKDALLHREWTAVLLRVGDPLRFYATDGIGVVRIDSDASVKGAKARSVLIPESVCSQISSIASALSAKPEDIKVSLSTGDRIRVDFEKDGALPVRLIGKLVPEKAPDYEALIEDLQLTAKPFAIPDDFYRAVAKVAAVTSSDMEPKCVLETGSEFVVSGEHSLGSARTVFELKKPVKKARAVVHPERLRRYAGLLTTICVEPGERNGIAMHGSGIDYYTSCEEDKEEEGEGE